MTGAAVMMGLLAAFTCSSRDGGPPGRSTVETRPVGGDDAEVTVSGHVSRVLGVHVFEIAGADAADPVLVVNPDSGRVARVGERLEVTGPVRRFQRSVLEAEYGLRFEAAVEELEGRSCMVVRMLSPRAP